MAEESEEAGKNELERALYSVDQKVICEFFQRDKLWTSEVSPVLLAAATLQAMLGSSASTHHQCYSEAVQLLEFVHSESPQLGHDVEYIDLLVELKTRAVLYELFEEVEITEKLKKKVLTKFLGKSPVAKKLDSPKNTAEYNKYLHARARLGLETVLSSDVQWQRFRLMHLFNREKSCVADSALLMDLSRYLSAIRLSLQQSPTQTQQTIAVNGEVRGDYCDQESGGGKTAPPTASPHKEQQSSSTEQSQSASGQGRKRRRGRPRKDKENKVDETKTDRKSRVVGGRVPYNLRQRKEEVEEGMVGSGRGGINDVETKTGNERSGVNYGVQSRRVMFHYGLTPVKLVRSDGKVQRQTLDLPAYATPPRTSVPLALKRLIWEERYKRPASTMDTETQNAECDDEPNEEEEDGVAVVETDSRGLDPSPGRYQLRQRRTKVNMADNLEGSMSSDSRESPLGGRGRKRKRHSSTEARSSDLLSLAAFSPRVRRQVVFYDASKSFRGRGRGRPRKRGGHKKAVGRGGRAQVYTDDGDDESESALRRSRRKQVTPRRLPNTLTEKLMAQVHFSPREETTQQQDASVAAQTVGRAPIDGDSHSAHNVRVSAHTTDGTGECGTVERGVLRSQNYSSHTRHHRQPSYPSHTGDSSTHRVVDLADVVEPSQPNSQWDYVAVQTVAESATELDRHPRRDLGRRVFRCGAGGQVSDADSDHEQVSVVTYSSDEVALAPLNQRRWLSGGGGGDKLSVVSESSPGSSSPPLTQPALLSLDTLRRPL